MKQKKIPMRICIACRESKPKKELIRIVKNKEGELNVDTTGKMPGRGAYLCPSVACLERAFKTKALQRALEVNMTEEMLSEIKRIILRRELGV